MTMIPKPVWAVGFALEQTLHVVALAVFSFLILKRLQHIFDKMLFDKKQIMVPMKLRHLVCTRQLPEGNRLSTQAKQVPESINIHST
ncbi:MAG: hypothetical protein LBH59_00695 [Planctomycetaceae bacterium]|nr:hypothetical protein [Planctomycetaceae bacterium]